MAPVSSHKWVEVSRIEFAEVPEGQGESHSLVRLSTREWEYAAGEREGGALLDTSHDGSSAGLPLGVWPIGKYRWWCYVRTFDLELCLNLYLQATAAGSCARQAPACGSMLARPAPIRYAL